MTARTIVRPIRRGLYAAEERAFPVGSTERGALGNWQTVVSFARAVEASDLWQQRIVPRFEEYVAERERKGLPRSTSRLLVEPAAGHTSRGGLWPRAGVHGIKIAGRHDGKLPFHRTKVVVLHELAHVAAKARGVCDSHGPYYAGEYLLLLEYALGPWAGDLFMHELRVGGCDAVVPRDAGGSIRRYVQTFEPMPAPWEREDTPPVPPLRRAVASPPPNPPVAIRRPARSDVAAHLGSIAQGVLS